MAQVWPVVDPQHIRHRRRGVRLAPCQAAELGRPQRAAVCTAQNRWAALTTGKGCDSWKDELVFPQRRLESTCRSHETGHLTRRPGRACLQRQERFVSRQSFSGQSMMCSDTRAG